MSPGFPGNYGSDQQCQIINLPQGVPLLVEAFDTQAQDDFIVLNGLRYSGTSGPSGVAVPPDGIMTWQSNDYTERSGWKICWGGSSADSNSTSTSSYLAASVGVFVNPAYTADEAHDMLEALAEPGYLPVAPFISTSVSFGWTSGVVVVASAVVASGVVVLTVVVLALVVCLVVTSSALDDQSVLPSTCEA